METVVEGFGPAAAEGVGWRESLRWWWCGVDVLWGRWWIAPFRGVGLRPPFRSAALCCLLDAHLGT